MKNSETKVIKPEEVHNCLQPLKKYKYKVAMAPILKIVECLTQLLTPFLIKYIIDKGIANNDAPYVWKIGGIIFGLALLAFCITMIAQYYAARVAADYGYDLRKVIYDRMLSLSEKQLNKFGKQKALNLINNDAFYMQNGVMMFMRLIFRPIFLVIGSIILAFITNWIAGCIVLGVFFFSSLVIGFVMWKSPKLYADMQQNLDELSTIGSDALEGSRPIRAFNKQSYEKERFAESSKTYRNKSFKIATINVLLNPMSFFFINLGKVLVVYLGGLSKSNGLLTSGDIVSLLSYLGLVFGALIMFSRLIVSINRARASRVRIDDFLKLEPEILTNVVINDTVDNDELIRFENVYFSYGGEAQNTLKNISFVLNKGESLGIIGGTGSGKSTLIALISRLYDVKDGRIYWKNQPIEDVDTNTLRKSISVVSQKPSIFKGTIESNLRIANPDCDVDEINKALKDSLAWNYVSEYEDGIKHEVEEFGGNLSGGQKQRLLIARSLLKDSELLILDDSTSALDYLSDRQVRTNISLKENLTKIYVSQRATSLSSCDKIIVLDKGQIVGLGTHEELLENCEIYQDIYRMQVANQ